MVSPPLSLFHIPSAAVRKTRQKLGSQKVMLRARSHTRIISTFPGVQALPDIPSREPPRYFIDIPEWLVHEDYSVSQVIREQSIPLNLNILNPAHTPNWDLTSDAGNTGSHLYRTPNRCKWRYTSVIEPRENGKIVCDSIHKRPKKPKGIFKTIEDGKKVAERYQRDNNASYIRACHSRYKMLIRLNRKPKPRSGPKLRPRKFAKRVCNLTVSDMNCGESLNPMQIADNRADRIGRKKTEQSTTCPSPAIKHMDSKECPSPAIGLLDSTPKKARSGPTLRPRKVAKVSNPTTVSHRKCDKSLTSEQIADYRADQISREKADGLDSSESPSPAIVHMDTSECPAPAIEHMDTSPDIVLIDPSKFLNFY